MTVFKNRHFTGGLLILVLALFGFAFLTISSSYFNTSEINLASTRCYEIGGEVILEIHNNFTSEYSFECKK
ncbi:hypothetical protein MHH33_13240 [Paenisporosarcina sp. FSL H8-0542]|uniref:hypothetical protein n=1 Tax=unclassified Paenisporosarcina TaxID=2642018 RepID=UPI00034E4F6F|nr:hypothetical protein [Paenisporosarcina sp. HGH0030]EPD52115.1 hypothetical protein HMPREF1210_01468 [Paenisporosarcina sp. HGH0030]